MALRPATYKGPDTTEGYDFAGWLALDMFQIGLYHRRLENCNYTGGKDLGDDIVDAQGWDCNEAKDTLSVLPFFQAFLYYSLHIHPTPPPGWDPEMSNEY